MFVTNLFVCCIQQRSATSLDLLMTYLGMPSNESNFNTHTIKSGSPCLDCETPWERSNVSVVFNDSTDVIALSADTDYHSSVQACVIKTI